MNQDLNACYKSETDIFSPPPIQTTIEQGSWDRVTPLAGFERGTIEFDIAGTDEYIDLSETEFRAQLSLRKIDAQDETKSEPISAEEKVGEVNNLLHSLFDQITVSLNGTQIENSNGSYGYRAYLEKLLNYGTDAKETHLFSSLFIKDKAGQMNSVETSQNTSKVVKSNVAVTISGTAATVAGTDVTVMPVEPANYNPGFVKRRHFLVENKSIELCDKLHIDLFNSNRYLLNKVPIKLKLERSKNSFVLMGPGDESKYFIFIEKCALYVRKVKLSPSIMADHLKSLQMANALYPIRRVIVKNHTISEKVVSETIDNIYVGKMPRRVVVGFVKHNAFNGAIAENPFNFQHFNIEKIKLYVAGHPIPYREDLNFDFDKNQYVRGYNTLYKGLYRSLYDTGNDITYEDYKNGYTLFAFNTTPDLCDSEHSSLPTTGELQLEVKFKKETPSNITAVFYLEFDNVVQINNLRQILFDYKV